MLIFSYAGADAVGYKAVVQREFYDGDLEIRDQAHVELYLEKTLEQAMASYMIHEIALMAGYKSPAHFSRIFKSTRQCTPSEYRAKCASRPNPTTSAARGATGQRGISRQNAGS